MKATSIDIKDLLVAAGIGIAGTNLFVGIMPDSPDACVALYDTGGFELQAGYDYRYPTVQIAIRGAVRDYSGAYNKALSIVNELHGKYNVTQGGSRYIGIWCMGDVNFIEYDERNRPLFTVNFRIHRTASS